MKVKTKSQGLKENLSLRGRTFSGVVISRRMHKTAKVQWERTYLIKKYERYGKRKSSVMAHIPDDIEVNEGDIILVENNKGQKIVGFFDKADWLGKLCRQNIRIMSSKGYNSIYHKEKSITSIEILKKAN
mgnify:CR=1 FL=1